MLFDASYVQSLDLPARAVVTDRCRRESLSISDGVGAAFCWPSGNTWLYVVQAVVRDM